MIITAYKSEADGKIFEDRSKYQAHLRKLARHRLEQKKLLIAREAKDAACGKHSATRSLHEIFPAVRV